MSTLTLDVKNADVKNAIKSFEETTSRIEPGHPFYRYALRELVDSVRDACGGASVDLGALRAKSISAFKAALEHGVGSDKYRNSMRALIEAAGYSPEDT